jgi:hypothetical protein
MGNQLYTPADLTPGIYFLQPLKVGCVGFKTGLDVPEPPAGLYLAPVGNRKMIPVSPARSPVTVSTALPRLAIVIKINVHTLVHNPAKTESCGEDTGELGLIRLKSRQRVLQKLIIRLLVKAFPTFCEI